MPSPGTLRRVALVRIDVSEDFSASISRVTKIIEVGTTLTYLADSCRPDDGDAKVPPKCGFLQEPHGVRSQKTAFLTGLQFSS
jgi:hypothetical protein